MIWTPFFPRRGTGVLAHGKLRASSPRCKGATALSRFSASAIMVCGLAALSILGGCDLAPKQEKVTTGLPPEFPWLNSHGSSRISSQSRTIYTDVFYRSPSLQRLITLALAENRDIANQLAYLAEVEGNLSVQRASLLPAIGVRAAGYYEAPSDEAGYSFDPRAGRGAPNLRYYSAGIGFSSYELDLFGRILNLSRQDRERELSVGYNLRAITASTISDIAVTYAQLLCDKGKLRIARGLVAVSQRRFDRSLELLSEGRYDAIQLRDSEKQRDSALNIETQTLDAVHLDSDALRLLIGTDVPADIDTSEDKGARLSELVTDRIPTGLPSDLLLNRPDIISAEHAIRAANANIGAARAAFFPRVTITASEGISSLEFRKLFTPGALTWSASPAVSLPLLNWGQNAGALAMSKARKRETIAQYQKAVQTAFKEVADAISNLQESREALSIANHEVESQSTVASLEHQRLSDGKGDVISALSAQADLATTQLQQEDARASVVQNIIRLYTALGGGWDTEGRPALTMRSDDSSLRPAGLDE